MNPFSLKRSRHNLGHAVHIILIAGLISLGIAPASLLARTNGVAEVRGKFASPPDDARIMMRWWWFGPTVSKPELARELRVMKDAGLGGVEIQPVYPLELDDPQKGFRNTPYLSQEFLSNVRFTAEQAKALGLRVDMTLGSGWPFGGPHIDISEASARLLCERVPVPQQEHSIAVPAMENGEKLISAFLARGDKSKFSPEGIQQITEISDGRARIPEPSSGPQVVLFFISSRTGQQVKRPGIGAEGYVLDHFNREAISHHLTAVGDKLMQAFGPNPPRAVFSDSLEVYASDWTPNFLDEFKRRRGYDLTPFLPALFGDIGDETTAIRHDWGKTLTELAEKNYLTPVREWAHQHHTLFRSQTYGEPPVILSSNALVDLPEGEFGPHWRSFSTTRWAASADHIYNRPVTSSETWTWLHSPAFRATPLDMKAEADLHFIEGVNQLVGHGWPYSPPLAGEPGYRFYASAVFNEHNPWFQVMPELTHYMQRLSYLLREGQPVIDVAVYLPTDDAWASLTPGHAAADKAMDKIIGPRIIPQILDAGYDFDFVDDRTLAKDHPHYSVIVLPNVESIPLPTLEHLRDFMEKGGTVIATRQLPSRAPGKLEAKAGTPQVQQLVSQLFGGGGTRARLLDDEAKLGSALRAALAPDIATDSGAPAIGYIHRKLPDAEAYFVVNTSNHDVHTKAHVRVKDMRPEIWDPFTGKVEPCAMEHGENDPGSLDLHLAPYESRLYVFSRNAAAAPQNTAIGGVQGTLLDISSDWKVTFGNGGPSVSMSVPKSWTDLDQERFFSGKATYVRSIDVPQTFVSSGRKTILDFGPGEKVESTAAPGAPGMRALLESPVRECALVYVNGQLTGSVWHPPFELEITKFLHAGPNELRLVVANTAINEIAGRALPSYKLLNMRYGERFTPQGFENLKPIPSGVLGSIHLESK